MKKRRTSMKKLLKITALLLIALSVAAALCACVKDDPDVDDGTKKITVIFSPLDRSVAKTIELETKSQYLEGVINEINAGDYQVVFQLITGNPFGSYIDSYSVNGVTFNDTAKGIYPYTYTTITDITYITPGDTVTIGGNAYFACGLGISAMPVIDGETYVFTVVQYS